MYNYLIQIYLKQLGASSADDVNRLVRPDELREGDRYDIAFCNVLSFGHGSDADILHTIYALFSGEGSEHPAGSVRLPRPLSPGDIIVGGMAVTFLVTEDGFRALPFTPRGEHYELTAEVVARELSWKRKSFHPRRQTAEARPTVEGQS